MPSVRDLMKEFRVGQGLIQQALDTLEEEGVLVRQVGRGTFVSKTGAAVTRTVTILHGDYPSRRGQEISRQITEVLRADNHHPFQITYPSMDAAMELLRSAGKSDAYVLQPMTTELPIELLAFLRRRTPAVVVDGEMRGVDVDSADTDWRAGLETSIEHLRELGHDRIALASGEPREMWVGLIEHFERIRRWSGLVDTLGPVLECPTRPGESSTVGLRERVRTLLVEHDRALPFSALIVSSYASATGAMEALFEAGVRVPDDLSLLVMDNPDMGSATFPQLTMVGHTSEEIARRIVSKIEYRWAHPKAPYHCEYAAPSLVARASTAPRRPRG